MGYSPWCHKESDTTDQLTLSISFPSKEELNKALGEGPNASESEKAGATRHPAVKVQESSCRFKKGSRGVTGMLSEGRVEAESEQVKTRVTVESA